MAVQIQFVQQPPAGKNLIHYLKLNMTVNYQRRILHTTKNDWVDDFSYVIVDNGSLCWPTPVPPLRVTNKTMELCLSKWVEYMKKDVKCAFSILKG
ncbi:hypothetical protein ACHAWX_001104 [Stephanocyclus meneghinianus]